MLDIIYYFPEKSIYANFIRKLSLSLLSKE